MMKNLKVSALIIFAIYLISQSTSIAEEHSAVSISNESYLSYQSDLNSGKNQFMIKRSYLTVKKSLFKHLNFRITIDAHQDATGDLKARLKYIFANFKFDDFAFITKSNIEFGQAHMPWLDFEEHINYYRMQGSMFMERNHLFNSSAFGFTYAGLIGGEMDDNYKSTVNKHYAGRYGSFAIGAYNGGGYHAIEQNDNKVIEGRLTLRPLPDIIPGLQLTYFGTYGNSNVASSTSHVWSSDSSSIKTYHIAPPEWNTNAMMLSYEHKYFTLTGQYVFGKGNSSGSYHNYNETTYTNKAVDYTGYSVFGEAKLGNHWRFIARYENFDYDTNIDNNANQRLITGIAYDFGHHNVLLLDYDKNMFDQSDKDDIDLMKLTMQIHF